MYVRSSRGSGPRRRRRRASTANGRFSARHRAGEADLATPGGPTGRARAAAAGPRAARRRGTRGRGAWPHRSPRGTPARRRRGGHLRERQRAGGACRGRSHVAEERADALVLRVLDGQGAHPLELARDLGARVGQAAAARRNPCASPSRSGSRSTARRRQGRRAGRPAARRAGGLAWPAALRSPPPPLPVLPPSLSSPPGSAAARRCRHAGHAARLGRPAIARRPRIGRDAEPRQPSCCSSSTRIARRSSPRDQPELEVARLGHRGTARAAVRAIIARALARDVDQVRHRVAEARVGEHLHGAMPHVLDRVDQGRITARSSSSVALAAAARASALRRRRSAASSSMTSWSRRSCGHGFAMCRGDARQPIGLSVNQNKVALAQATRAAPRTVSPRVAGVALPRRGRVRAHAALARRQPPRARATCAALRAPAPSAAPSSTSRATSARAARARRGARRHAVHARARAARRDHERSRLGPAAPAGRGRPIMERLWRRGIRTRDLRRREPRHDARPRYGRRSRRDLHRAVRRGVGHAAARGRAGPGPGHAARGRRGRPRRQRRATIWIPGTCRCSRARDRPGRSRSATRCWDAPLPRPRRDGAALRARLPRRGRGCARHEVGRRPRRPPASAGPRGFISPERVIIAGTASRRRPRRRGGGVPSRPAPRAAGRSPRRRDRRAAPRARSRSAARSTPARLAGCPRRGRRRRRSGPPRRSTRPLGALEAIDGDLVIGPSIALAAASLDGLRSVGGALRVVANGDLHALALPRLERAGRIAIEGNSALARLLAAPPPRGGRRARHLRQPGPRAGGRRRARGPWAPVSSAIASTTPAWSSSRPPQLARACAIRVANNATLPDDMRARWKRRKRSPRPGGGRAGRGAITPPQYVPQDILELAELGFAYLDVSSTSSTPSKPGGGARRELARALDSEVLAATGAAAKPGSGHAAHAGEQRPGRRPGEQRPRRCTGQQRPRRRPGEPRRGPRRTAWPRAAPRGPSSARLPRRGPSRAGPPRAARQRRRRGRRWATRGPSVTRRRCRSRRCPCRRTRRSGRSSTRTGAAATSTRTSIRSASSRPRRSPSWIRPPGASATRTSIASSSRRASTACRAPRCAR